MCVLASREHTCIHPEVSRSSNKNEGCKELTDAKKLRSVKMCFRRHFGFINMSKRQRETWTWRSNYHEGPLFRQPAASLLIVFGDIQTGIFIFDPYISVILWKKPPARLGGYICVDVGVNCKFNTWERLVFAVAEETWRAACFCLVFIPPSCYPIGK